MSIPVHTRPPGRDGLGVAIGVVILTGAAGLAGMAINARMTAIDWALTALIAIITVGGAIALLRFASRHAGEIGEARFDTRQPDDRDRPPSG